MIEWISNELKVVADIYNGSTPSTSVSENFNGSVIWITPKDISNQNGKYIKEGERNLSELGLKAVGNKLLPIGTILLSSRAPIGLLSIAKVKLCTNQGFKNIVVKNDKIDNEYLFYYFKNNLKSISALGTGTTFKEVSKATLESFSIKYPKEITAQKQIASVLSALDDKIEINIRINQEFEGMSKLLYDYWFVQFDFPDANGKPYKSAGGKMVYDEVLKREIPEGWKVNSLSDFISNDKSGDWGKEEAEGNYNTKVECIRGADINGINGKGEVKAPKRFILEKNEHKILQELDLVVEISGGSPTQSTGRLAFITREVMERFDNPLICSNFCKAVSLQYENQFFFFVNSWNRAYDNGILFGFEGKTSGIKNLLFDMFVNNYNVATPEENLLTKFQNITSLYEKKRQVNLKQNQKLAELRDWLLPMLMNGQVTVGGVEEGLNMAAEPGVRYGLNK